MMHYLVKFCSRPLKPDVQSMEPCRAVSRGEGEFRLSEIDHDASVGLNAENQLYLPRQSPADVPDDD